MLLQFRKPTEAQKQKRQEGLPYHSLRLPHGVEPGLIPLEALERRFQILGVPEDLRERSVLDIGCASGWCSFEAERRGARVTAVDCVAYPEFLRAREELSSRVEFCELDVEELSAARLGQFDYVLFLGVLYHLRHPLLGLERVCEMTRGTAYIESFVVDTTVSEEQTARAPWMEFYERDELGGQIDNWWGPTAECVYAMCRAAGFADTQRAYVDDRRAAFRATRRLPWPAEESASIRLSGASNTRTNEPTFHAGKDEYIAAYFDCEACPGDVLVRIGDAEYPTVTLSATGDGAWQTNAKFPAWLPAGEYDVRVRVGTALSAAVRVSVAQRQP